MNTILYRPSLPESLQRVLRDDYGAVELPEASRAQMAFLQSKVQDVEVLVTSGPRGADAGLIAALPALRAIVSFGVGVDAIDLHAARERGIRVSNTPDVLTDAVADLAVALYLDLLRGVSAADRYVRRGDWGREPRRALGRDATGRRVGILGLGRIGRAIARRLQGFGCDIAYFSRSPRDDVDYQYFDTPEKLAQAVEVLFITVAGGAETRDLVNRRVLEALGRGYLVNVSRGTVVDEDALIEALEKGRLAGAALDVFAREPRVPDALRKMDNVVLTPHMGSATEETRVAMVDLALANLRSFLEYGRLVTPVV